MMRSENKYSLLTSALLACVTLLFAGCDSTPVRDKPRAESLVTVVPARIEIQEAVGFTIIEESNITGGLRLDYDRAQQLLEQGRIADAIELLEGVAEAAPTLSAPHIDLGIAYHRLGELQAAEAHLNAALAVNASHPVALNELGIVYRRTARFQQARQSYEAALAVYPGFHYARRNLAVLCDLYLDDLDCALENYAEYVAMVDDDADATTWYKSVRFRAGQME